MTNNVFGGTLEQGLTVKPCCIYLSLRSRRNLIDLKPRRQRYALAIVYSVGSLDKVLPFFLLYSSSHRIPQCAVTVPQCLGFIIIILRLVCLYCTTECRQSITARDIPVDRLCAPTTCGISLFNSRSSGILQTCSTAVASLLRTVAVAVLSCLSTRNVPIWDY